MDETSKTRKLWGPAELKILTGKGIDIGCGPDPVNKDAMRFDIEHGDANYITRYLSEEFDYVYSSHCLEHMHKPKEALLEWWKLVRLGGHIFFIVPDEDLYEQGVFPSRFNPDHKATFTISKQKSWSSISINVLDLAMSLPGSKIVSIKLQDQGYDRKLMKHGEYSMSMWVKFLFKIYNKLKVNFGVKKISLEILEQSYITYDQTLKPNTSAQIQCIVQKVANE
jgi:SAM-dependent methyltransferase